MAPKKLSDSDKQEILDRYRHSEETTATLATQYGVSTSTISRILKQNLSEQEYDGLVQQKRLGSRLQLNEDDHEDDADFASVDNAVAPLVEEPAAKPEDRSRFPTPTRRQRKRSLAVEASSVSQLELPSLAEPFDVLDAEASLPQTLDSIDSIDESALVVGEEFVDLEADLDEDADLDEGELADEDEELDDLEGDLEDEDDLEDADDEDEMELPDGYSGGVHIQSSGLVQVLPFSEAAMPRTCYVVVDRASELITRPLKDFADLGQIPVEEIQEKTLPIFDNHRVAKRFLRRMQRIVKVPDTRVFQKVKPYLQAKGITRLLIDGQVYSL
ncbi:MAG: helix-turn-helix domain-containing protein [Synechococcales cyanobacterium M58_A2018_015]|nr:helix-turn-helix domain-containing protein [Synechococcales cyanobacterium M58_A2018_015]